MPEDVKPPEVLLFGEPMVLLIADEYGDLKDINNFRRKVAGAELNVCVGLNRLGHTPTFVTRLGKNDPFGKFIVDFLEGEGIDTSKNVTMDEHRLTGFMLKNKVDEGDPEIFYYRKNSAASNLSPRDLADIDYETLKHLHVTGIACGVSDSCLLTAHVLVNRAKEHGVFVSFDPNIRKSLWKDTQTMISSINDIAFMSDLVMPGIEEGKILTGKDTVEEIADFYINRGVKEVIIKTGKSGSYYKTFDGREGFVDGIKVEKVVDTVGAGDAFACGVISGRLEDLSIENYVKRGNIMGAMQVQVEGDNEGLPTREELFLHEKK